MATPTNGLVPHQPPLVPSPAAADNPGISITSDDSFTFQNGDVQILIKYSDGVEVTGSVSSHAMSLASPVWNKFIFPPFGPTAQPADVVSEQGAVRKSCSVRQQPVEQIDFREDDPEALRILLRIAHLKFGNIPSELSYKTLLNMAVLCDQYDCIDLVVLFLQKWLSNEEIESKEPGRVNWLFIAWVFGRRQVFEELAKHLVLRLWIQGGNEYFVAGERIEEPLPAGILESILEVRRRTIASILDACYSETKFYESSQDIRMQCWERCESCRAMIYGSLVLGLENINLWPERPVSQVYYHVDGLAENISKLRVYTWTNNNHQEENHEFCHKGCFQGHVHRVLENIPNPVLDAHYEHMDAVSELLARSGIVLYPR